MQGSSDGYVGELTASEECFCHYQHFSDRFLIVPLKLQYIGNFVDEAQRDAVTQRLWGGKIQFGKTELLK